MKAKIDTHDLDFKARTAVKLLGEGDKVKVSVMFRGREITHPQIGREILEKFQERVKDAATVERAPALEGRFMTMYLSPAVAKPVQEHHEDQKGEAEKVEKAEGSQP